MVVYQNKERSCHAKCNLSMLSEIFRMRAIHLINDQVDRAGSSNDAASNATEVESKKDEEWVVM